MLLRTKLPDAPRYYATWLHTPRLLCYCAKGLRPTMLQCCYATCLGPRSVLMKCAAAPGARRKSGEREASVSRQNSTETEGEEGREKEAFGRRTSSQDREERGDCLLYTSPSPRDRG
eukprot:992037-Rhodomonas_salina.1